MTHSADNLGVQKRVGIKTVARNVVLSNYGSFFQHYALRKVIRQIGFLPYRIESGSWTDELLKWVLPLRLFRIWVMSWFGLKKFPGWGGLSLLVLRMKFIRDYRRVIGMLFEDQGRACAYVAGGDSVWYECNKEAFLMGYEGKKIAYAASSCWDYCANEKNWCSLAKEALGSYSAIGVREAAGETLLKRIDANLNPQVVVDPVMLLLTEEWLHLADCRRAFSRPTLLYYVVNAQTGLEINIDAVKECAARLKCDLVCVGIQGAEVSLPQKHLEMPSPTRFLAMMRDARYVVTNSFHGIVFSVVLNKPFAFVLQRMGARGDVNLRQRELLERFKLIDRGLGVAPTAGELVGVLTRSMDMVSLNGVLSCERSRCLNWLKAALK